jgi:glucan phosphoethanolaminetransferase (alkaline phosphatase superfamily)
VTNDNERQGATLKVGISSYVGTATLALIAGAVALFTYIQQHYRLSWIFYLFIMLALVALVASFIFGGRGANSTVKAVANGTWDGSTKTADFNRQAILTVIGLLFILVAAGLGLTSPYLVTEDPCVKFVSTQLARPHPDIPQLRHDLAICEASRS